ncbi:MAG: o-succinylbenzoate synthase [Kurthia sp.]|nr:o-succinylbenzoate synthase [Candidatus Kurthia equi]
MKIVKFIVRMVEMPMKHAFSTSFGTVKNKRFIIVEAYDEAGNCGYGECDAFEQPWYTEETVETCWHMIHDFFIPRLLNLELKHPSEVREVLDIFRRNRMAKAGIETAIWDVYAKRLGKPLYEVIGGRRNKVPVGVSIGLQSSTNKLYEVIDEALANGAQRIKVKIKPGQDIELVTTIRQRYPQLPLMVDANSAYTLQDMNLLQQLDQFDLLMIEQPLGANDIYQHAQLQKQLKTPICLDESICSLEDAMTAIELKACRIFNIKIARVGGIQEAKLIHNKAAAAGMKMWGGGMLEAGIGRAQSVAIATLEYFTLPADTSGSSHYFEQDIIHPEVVVENGFITLPDKAGIGYQVDEKILDIYTLKKTTNAI